MRWRSPRFLVVLALLISFSGCPGAVSISLGTWLVTVKRTGQDTFALAFELLSNGQIQAPNPVPSVADDPIELGGSWSQSGSIVTMVENKIGENWVYTGTAHSSTSMSGTWAEDDEPTQPLGEWAATWLP